MVPSSAGAVVLVPFPLSDLSQSKLRPAVVLADAGKGDGILCQVTSKAFADPVAVMIEDTDFTNGSLCLVSDARPGKLFTASDDLFASKAGLRNATALPRSVDAVVAMLRPE